MIDSETHSHRPPKSTMGPPITAYVVPMILFMLLTWVEGRFPAVYIWIYFAKTAIITASLAFFYPKWKQEIRFDARVLPLAIVIGLAVFAEWILVDTWVKYPHITLGARTALNPFLAIPQSSLRMAFIAVRLFGIAVMVPIVEELFWRSFLLRYLTDQDFWKLPVGSFSWSAFAIVAVSFGFSHPEWLAAVLCAIAYGLLLKRTRSLFACIVAHGVTNLVLALYVLEYHAWRFW